MVRFSDQADWPSGMIKSAFIKADNGEMNLESRNSGKEQKACDVSQAR